MLRVSYDGTVPTSRDEGAIGGTTDLSIERWCYSRVWRLANGGASWRRFSWDGMTV